MDRVLGQKYTGSLRQEVANRKRGIYRKYIMNFVLGAPRLRL